MCIGALHALAASGQASCPHLDTYFSRIVCACGWMHDYCSDCGEQLDPCEDSEEVEANTLLLRPTLTFGRWSKRDGSED